MWMRFRGSSSATGLVRGVPAKVVSFRWHPLGQPGVALLLMVAASGCELGGTFGRQASGCRPETDEVFCRRFEKRCGAFTNIDNCGAVRTVASCGLCAPGEGGGTAGGLAGGTAGGIAGGIAGGTAGGIAGGLAGGTAGGTAGGLAGGTAGGIAGGLAGGTAGGIAGGLAGGTASGMAGGLAGGTASGIAGGLAGGTASGIAGGLAGGTAGGGSACGFGFFTFNGGCVQKRTCAAGAFTQAEGTDTSDRVCSPCPLGTFSTTTNAPFCAPWTTCPSATFVRSQGSATSDRGCSPCVSATYSTTTNASSCTPWTTCPAGTFAAVQGTSSSDRICSSCSTGTFSTTNASTCTPWTTCQPGTFVQVQGSSSSNRACNRCAERTFSTTINASSCTPWTACLSNTFVQMLGTTTSDQVCGLCPPGWTGTNDLFCSGVRRQFGSSWFEEARGLVVDGAGNILVAGFTSGALPGETSAGFNDAFVMKYTSVGNLLWSRQFGSNHNDYARVAVDAAGNVFAAGSTRAPLQPATSAATGAFVRKYDPAGNVLWTRQPGSSTFEWLVGVAVDTRGNVIVVGSVDGRTIGTGDAFVRVYDSAGNVLWMRQFGSSGADGAQGVAVDAAGSVFVVGFTEGAIPGETSAGATDAFVRKYDSAGFVLWTRQFGTSDVENALGVAVDAAGNVLVSGSTAGTLSGGFNAGSRDAYVRKYDSAGVVLWTRQYGSGYDDVAASVAVDATGNVILAGSTQSKFPGQQSAGGNDALARKYDSAGNIIWTRQFGTSAHDGAHAVAVDAAKNVLLAGNTEGALMDQTSAGRGDAFFIVTPP
jgi:hypothetical protein